MAYTGQCACGAVKLAINGDALGVTQCWCRQCQKSAAGGPTQNAIFFTNDVAITGALGGYGYVAASGNKGTQEFCAACGTPVIGRNSALPQFLAVRLGVIDSPHELAPQQIIWMQEAPAWAVVDPALPHLSTQPGPN